MKIWFQNRRYKLKRQLQEKGIEQGSLMNSSGPLSRQYSQQLQPSCNEYDNSMRSSEDAYEAENCVTNPAWQSYAQVPQTWYQHQQASAQRQNWVTSGNGNWNPHEYRRYQAAVQHHQNGYYTQTMSASSTTSSVSPESAENGIAYRPDGLKV